MKIDWKDVSDELPKNDYPYLDECLVFCVDNDNGRTSRKISCYIHPGFAWDCEEDDEDITVTHWVYLNEIPEPDIKEQNND